MEKSERGTRYLVVPAPDYSIKNKDVRGFRRFVFTERNGEITGGEIVEFFGTPSFISAHKKDLPARKDDQEIKGYDGSVIRYDINYRYRGGSMFKNGKKQKGTVQIRSGSQATLKKMAKGNKTADYTDPQPGCEYYFLVWYDTYTYEIIDWIYLGEWCPDDEENPYGNEGESGGSNGGDICHSCGGGVGNATPNLNKLMKNINALTQAVKDKLETLLNEILLDCAGQALNSFLNTNNIKFDFAINSTMSPQATYNSVSDLITIKDPTTLSRVNLSEELFHAYQNKTYTNGTAQYAGTAGSANIEFEAKILRDITQIVVGNGGGMALNSSTYSDFIFDITSGFTKFPTSFTSTQMTSYYGLVQEFVNTSGYSNISIDNNLAPQGLFNLAAASTCPQ